MRRLVPVIVALALAALAAVALARVDDAPAARLTASAAAGSFEVSDSGEGEPIFAATDLAPGGSARGTVTIVNTGSTRAALILHRGDLTDAPGLGGGLLSDRLRLTVVDVTAPATPRTVYAGPLATMPDQPAGDLDPGKARTFEFTATLPDGGEPAFENALQGASLTVAYAWIAEEAGGGTEDEGEAEAGGGEGPAPESGAATPGAGNGGGGARGGGSEAEGGAPGRETVLDLTVPKVKAAVNTRQILAWTRCNESCRLTVRGRLRAYAAGHHRGARIRLTRKRLSPARAQRLHIPIPRKLRAWLLRQPPPLRLRAALRFSAVGVDGRRDVTRKQVRLRVRRN